MKANLLKSIGILCLTFIQLFCFSTVFAKSSGGAIAGGGGDSYEKRVDEIRADILGWIKLGGSKGLNLDLALSHEEYISLMTKVLAPKYVVVNFVEKDHESDEELQVTVNGIPKTCRGFLSKKDNRPHILCDLNRFKKTTESDQYRLIHHEYAGLIGVERNDGAASDYFISSQLTSYLQMQSVLKLTIKKADPIVNRAVPFIELKSSKYIKNRLYEITLVARNMQDVSEVKLIPYFDKNWDSCNLPQVPLIFSETVMEHKILVGEDSCPDSHRPANFEEGIIEFRDGVIQTLGFQKISYVSNFDLKNVPKLKVSSTTIKEVVGQKRSFYGNKLKTIKRTVKFTFNAKAEDFKNIRVIRFGNNEEIVTDDPQKMAELINAKEIYYDFDYVQNTDVKSYLCFGVETCKINREILLKTYELKEIRTEGKRKAADFIDFLSNDFKPVPRFILLRDVYPSTIK